MSRFLLVLQLVIRIIYVPKIFFEIYFYRILIYFDSWAWIRNEILPITNQNMPVELLYEMLNVKVDFNEHSKQ